MRRFFNISFIQLLLSIISALLMAQMSWVGKLGISLFYKNYAILKDPIQSGVAVFLAQIIVVIILHLSYIAIGRKATRILSVIFFILACIGLTYTIYDFTEEFSHKILKYKFHFGFYLIWLGFIITSIYYFFTPQRKRTSEDKIENPTTTS